MSESISSLRHCTVVYADLSGFTAISEKLDPEQVTDAMNRCFEVLEDIIIGRGGVVNKYLGDALFALFDVDGETDTDTAGSAPPSRGCLRVGE